MKYNLNHEQQKRLENWHWHAPKDDQIERYQAINEATRLAAETIMRCSPVSREQSSALARLEEARMWANAAVALNE